MPSVNITEMWAFPMRGRNKLDNWDVIERNRLAMQWIRNAYITLYQEPYKIIYFTLRDIPPAYELKLWILPLDLVLYNHQTQFKRKNWKKLKRCMRYMKSKQHVVCFKMPELSELKSIVFEQWEKNKSYYYKKSWERAYHEYETYFEKGSPKQALELAVQLQNSLTHNLEKMIHEGTGVEYVGTAEFGRAEYAFTTLVISLLIYVLSIPIQLVSYYIVLLIKYLTKHHVSYQGLLEWYKRIWKKIWKMIRN